MNFKIKLMQSSSRFWSITPCLWWETEGQENLQQAITKHLQGRLWFRGSSWSKTLMSFWNSYLRVWVFFKTFTLVALLTICTGKKRDENLSWGWNGESHVWSRTHLHLRMLMCPVAVYLFVRKGLKRERGNGLNGNEVILFIALF